MHAELLLKASYVVKTQVGISDQSYSSSDEQPLYGEGLGTKWATAAWVIISTLIVELMRKNADGIQYQDPRQPLLVKRIMDGFVDDTTIRQHLAKGLGSLSQGYTGYRYPTPDRRTMVGTTPARHRGTARIAQVLLLPTTLGIRLQRPRTARYTRGTEHSDLPPTKRRRSRNRHYTALLHDISPHTWRR
jgi:hypothetical protein